MKSVETKDWNKQSYHILHDGNTNSKILWFDIKFHPCWTSQDWHNLNSSRSAFWIRVWHFQRIISRAGIVKTKLTLGSSKSTFWFSWQWFGWGANSMLVLWARTCEIYHLCECCQLWHRPQHHTRIFLGWGFSECIGGLTGGQGVQWPP